MFGMMEALMGVIQRKHFRVQRGISAGAGNVTINSVNPDRTMIRSFSQGSAGYVAARGSISLSGTVIARNGGTAATSDGSGTDDWSASLSGSISGGTTDLTVKEYGATLVNATTINCTGACAWEVIEFV